MTDIQAHIDPDYAIECSLRHHIANNDCPEFASLTISWRENIGGKGSVTALDQLTLFFAQPEGGRLGECLKQAAALSDAIAEAYDDFDLSPSGLIATRLHDQE